MHIYIYPGIKRQMKVVHSVQAAHNGFAFLVINAEQINYSWSCIYRLKTSGLVALWRYFNGIFSLLYTP